MTPATLYTIFTAGFVPAQDAPADAADWLKRGYLYLIHQGKLQGYVVAPPAYRMIVDVYPAS